MSDKLTEARQLTDEYALKTELVSSREIHRRLGIRQPYALWVSRHLTKRYGAKSLDDYVKVGNDYFVPPVSSLYLLASGGSQLSIRCMLVQIEMIKPALAGRDFLEVLDTASKAMQSSEFLARELDPERYPNA